MITREAIGQTAQDCFVTGGFNDPEFKPRLLKLEALAEQLLKERDAYREVAQHWMWCFKDISRGRMKDSYLEEVDAEAARLLEQSKQPKRRRGGMKLPDWLYCNHIGNCWCKSGTGYYIGALVVTILWAVGWL